MASIYISLPVKQDTSGGIASDVTIVNGSNTLIVNPDGSINISGVVAATPEGLNIGGLITKVSINSTTWTALPATPLNKRNGVSVQNRSGVPIYFEYDPTKPTGDGILLPNGGERFYDIKQTILIYASTAGPTVTIYVEEIA